MPKTRAGRQTLIADDSASGLWNPMTRAFNTAEIKEVRLREWFGARPTLTYNVHWAEGEDLFGQAAQRYSGHGG